jgi:16S rRNA processing protein RimM
MTAQADEGLVELGRISGVHGVRGWVKVHSDTRPVFAIGEYRHWQLSGRDGWSRRRLLGFRAQGKGWVARIEGVDDRDAAELLVGASIAVPAAELPRLQAGEYYWRDLIGCEVVTLDGVRLGQVDHLMETGANDVLVVQGDRERLLPFVQGAGQTVREVDLSARRILVDWDPEF